MKNQKHTKTNKTGLLTDILNDSISNLKKVIDINTVVGKPILNEDGSIIVPVSKVYVGIVSGGGEMSNNNAKIKNFEFPFAGGTGTGFTVSPIGFLITKNGTTTFINTEVDKSGEKLMEMANKTLKILLQNLKKD